MKAILRGFALFSVICLTFYGLLLLALHTLPLELIWATPLNKFVTYRIAPTLRLRTTVAQIDEFWREVDKFATDRRLRWLPTALGVKRVFNEYSSYEGYSVVVQVAADGKTDISFFSLPPKSALLPPIVEDFKRHLSDYKFESWVDPNDVAQTASTR